MGRTYTNKREYDDWESPNRKKNSKTSHARNIPGRGMRVINSLSEDDYDEDLDQYDDEYYDNTTTTQR